jgi:hypothetical protein
MIFLEEQLIINGLRQHRDYFLSTVREVWATHVAPRQHDEREQKKKKL